MRVFQRHALRRSIGWLSEALLGTDVDRIVAKRIGQDTQYVARHRKGLGIPSYRARHGYEAAVSR